MHTHKIPFETRALNHLQSLSEQLEEQLGEKADVDFHEGILTIEFENGDQYLLNLHKPTQQIWLSSPKSGAHHFSWNETGDRWVSTRDTTVLKELLKSELQ